MPIISGGGSGGGSVQVAHGCRVTQSTGQSLASGGSGTALTFDTETWDTDAYHSNVTNPTRLTCPSGLAGTYQVMAVVATTTGSTSGTERDVILKKNGTTTFAFTRMIPSAALTTPVAIEAVGEIQLAATDYVEAVYFHDVGSAVTSSITGVFFALALIGT